MEYTSEKLISTDGQACIEQATVNFEGRAFVSGGAMITPTHCVGYIARDKATRELIITTFEGLRLGRARVLSTWKTPRSYVSSTLSQIEVTLDVSGVIYTGRGAGEELLYKGKRKAKQSSAPLH